MRKTKALRISQAKQLLVELEKAGIAGTYHGSYEFVKDMIKRLSAGKRLSAKQTRYLDDCIDKGVPDCKDEVLYTKICAAIKSPMTSERHASILKDFARRIYFGYSMSNKQKAFMNSMLKEAARPLYVPSDKEIERLHLAVKISQSRTDFYWGTHPGEAKAMVEVRNWLRADDRTEGLDKRSCNKLLHSARVGLREIDNPKFNPGDMASVRPYARGECPRENVLILSGPQVTSGHAINASNPIVYTTLWRAEVHEFTPNQLYKRLAKG